MAELLIELFSEEIPARMQARAADDLKRLMTGGLVDAGLTYSGAAAFATPRRLCLTLSDVPGESPATREERKGPKADASQKAIDGFLRSTGLTQADLEVHDSGKGKVLFAVIEKPGRHADEIVAEILEATIRNFPWPKSMKWGTGTLKWVRPLHSILAILSDETGARTVPVDIDGIKSADTTYGHRFMAPGAIAATSFEDYEMALKRAFVVLNATDRQEAIWNEATNLAFAQGLEIVEDKGLLAEVAGLVEWPVVLMGEIGAEFLDLPPEVLQTSMREHQKFFSVRNPKTGRIEKFITVANRETSDNGATILAGNQKVLAARLSDAKFFWRNDLRVARDGKMEPWLKSLEKVTFHAKLGTVAEKIERVAALAREIAPAVGADPDQAEQAARIAKADLASEMVYEFPELQGVMGRYYAQAAGLDDAVAAVAEEHWGPLGPSDDVPTAPLSVAVALADKIDTLTGFWAIDEKPTGSKDPFALRRAALGVLRTVSERSLSLRLWAFLIQSMHGSREIIQSMELKRLNLERAEFDAKIAVAGAKHIDSEKDQRLIEMLEQLVEENQQDTQKLIDDRNAEKIHPPNLVSDLLSFFHDRLKVYLRDKGVRHDVIDACIAMTGNDDLTLLVKRAEALQAIVGTEDGKNLVQGFKRANNILTQAEAADGVEYSYGPEKKLAEAGAEAALFDALDSAEAAITPAMEAEYFVAAMSAMATLRAPIDAFFEAVQVDTDNAVVRRNRLNLLRRIRKTCLSVADLTRIEG